LTDGNRRAILKEEGCKSVALFFLTENRKQGSGAGRGIQGSISPTEKYRKQKTQT
jgi:hypothetical protein